MRRVYLNGVQFGVPALAGTRGGACRFVRMRLTEFYRLVEDEFGGERAQWIVRSQVLPPGDETAAEMIENGVDPRLVWEGLCNAFDVPEERRLGVDRPGF